MSREAEAPGDGARAEPRELRLRRLRIRSARRGTREMDLILGGFAAAALETLPPASLDDFEVDFVGKRSRSLSMGQRTG